MPDIFQKIMSAGKIAEDEMYNTFNMGIGYVYVVDPPDADAVLKTLASLGENAAIIGKVVRHENH
jgi:phosphoribosylformylglycinamidine cyclo-ligase